VRMFDSALSNSKVLKLYIRSHPTTMLI